MALMADLLGVLPAPREWHSLFNPNTFENFFGSLHFSAVCQEINVPHFLVLLSCSFHIHTPHSSIRCTPESSI